MEDIDPIIQREVEVVRLFEVAMEQRYPIFCSVFGHNTTTILSQEYNYSENSIDFDFDSLEIYSVDNSNQEDIYIDDREQSEFNEVMFPDLMPQHECAKYSESIGKDDVNTIEEMQNLKLYLENHVIDEPALEPNYVTHSIQELIEDFTFT